MTVPRFLLIGILKFALDFRASTRTAVYTPQSSLLSFVCVCEPIKALCMTLFCATSFFESANSIKVQSGDLVRLKA